MRSPADLGRRPLVHSRRRVIILATIVALIIALFVLRELAFVWTDQLWFSALGFSNVFSTLLEVKIGLGLTFGVFFFLLLFGNLLLADRFGAKNLSFDADDELVRRFQELVRPYARRIYAGIALVAGLIAGLTAIGQWRNYILYANAQSFHETDPIFHKDIGFYVFKLPFLTFIVDWLLASLIIVIVLTAFFHYLNGGIRVSRSAPHVSPLVKAHLSVLLAAVAVMKALGYVIAKWQLVVSSNGYVEGAGYADIHARIPALTILFFLSLAAAVILLVNIRTRGWSLPLIAIGLWLVVAIAIGYIYPAALQALKVDPAQRTLEQPYIQRNINATIQAFGLTNVTYTKFAATAAPTTSDLKSSAATLANIRLWDPDPSIALETTQHLQDIQQYYNFSSLAVDRYTINNKVTPVLIGTRQINANGLAAPSWVNQHLVYTHGIGAVIIPANTEAAATGNPLFAVGNVPPTSSDGLPSPSPAPTSSEIYFGINQPGWVVAGTNQAELNYKTSSGTQVTNHYAVTSASGSVAAGGFFRRLAFAVRFGDFNMLISNQITSQSRVIYVRDVQQMVSKAAPFISWANDAYPVITNSGIDYVIDGFTTSNEYPYSENADNQNVSSSGGLPSSYNYIRNSVKAVVNAYTGQISFYVWDSSDPILQAYRAAFPGMFQPAESMPKAIEEHMRYPSALLAIQSATLGRYHIKQASAFYTASDQWSLSPTVGAGSPDQTLKRTTVTNSSDQIVSSSLTPMSPIYEVMSLPNSNTQQLVLLTAFQPAGGDVVQGITAFMTATSNIGDYGNLEVFETPRGQTVISPAQADAYMNQNAAASAQFTLLDKDGSSVILGNSLLVPIGQAILYVRPMYVTSVATASPQLRDVLVDFGTKVGFASTLTAALGQIFGNGTTTAPKGETASEYLADAVTAYTNAQTALHDGDLAKYQKDVGIMDRDIQLAQSALSKK